MAQPILNQTSQSPGYTALPAVSVSSLSSLLFSSLVPRPSRLIARPVRSLLVGRAAVLRFPDVPERDVAVEEAEFPALRLGVPPPPTRRALRAVAAAGGES